MATLVTAQRNSHADKFGVDMQSGSVVIKTSGAATLATLSLPSSFSAASGGTLSAALSGTGSANGTADNYEVKNSGGTVRCTGAIAELNLSTTSILNGSPISGTFTYTEQASTC